MINTDLHIDEHNGQKYFTFDCTSIDDICIPAITIDLNDDDNLLANLKTICNDKAQLKIKNEFYSEFEYTNTDKIHIETITANKNIFDIYNKFEKTSNDDDIYIITMMSDWDYNFINLCLYQRGVKNKYDLHIGNGYICVPFDDTPENNSILILNKLSIKRSD